MSGSLNEIGDGDVDWKTMHVNAFQEIITTLESMYGPNSTRIQDRIQTLKASLKEFWEFQREAVEESKQNLVGSIEEMGKEAIELEKALGLDEQVKYLDANVPLVETEEALWKLVESYRSLKAERMSQYDILQKKEEELCALLELTTTIPKMVDLDTASGKSPCCSHIPSINEIASFEQKIEELQHLKTNLEEEFTSYKMLLKQLMDECGVLPFSKVERAACASDEICYTLFPLSVSNLEKLKSTCQEFTDVKEQMMAEADALRQEITKLHKKLLKDQSELDDFLFTHSGFTKITIAELKNVLGDLKEERKIKLKDLILSHRTLLDDLWTRCCYTDHQRQEFRPYYVDYYSEEILDFHELEVEKLEIFFNKHKRIFELTEKHNELWDRLLQLEEESSHTDRLFNNRGGRLLLEEKERKTIQKKVPAIKAELVTLLNEFKAETSKDFLYFGSPLIEILEQREEERELVKENKKRIRKAANTENILLESRLGSRPVANKRKMLTPQQPNVTTKVMKMALSSTNSTTSTSSYKSAVSSTRGQKMVRNQLMAQKQPQACGLMLRSPAVPRVGVGAAAGSYATLQARTPSRTPIATPARTPAASTPENGSPSYESFQEHLEKSVSKKTCRSSTKNAEQRVLRPRDLNETVTKNSRATPYKTPKTPAKTPSKIPFRIATGGKIPSIVPPISPRSATKFTTPRSRLPIIF